VDLDHVGRLIDGLGSLAATVSVVAAFIELNTDDRPTTEQSGEAKPRTKGWRQVYLDARCLGLTADEFWNLSLRELWRELAVAEQQRRRAYDRDIELAWWTVALGRRKRLPALADMKAKGKPVVRQTWQDIKALTKVLAEETKEGAHGDR
jgi:hypothetical protein